MTSLDRSYQILQKRHVSEKATTDEFESNTFHMRVPRDANKIEIRQAVERLFPGVKVVRVNTLVVPSKHRRRGYVAGATQSWKKAMVTLADGHSLEVH